MKRYVTAVMLAISLAFIGCAGMSDTEQRTLSGGAIGAGAGAVVAPIAGNTAMEQQLGRRRAAGGYLYDSYEKTKASRIPERLQSRPAEPAEEQ